MLFRINEGRTPVRRRGRFRRRAGGLTCAPAIWLAAAIATPLAISVFTAPNIAERGIQSTTDEPGVPIYIEDAYFGRSEGSILDLLDLERDARTIIHEKGQP